MGCSCFGNLACQAEFQFVCELCVCVCVWLGSVCCCYKNNNNAAQHIETTSGPVAQWIRHRPTEPGIAGPSPAEVIVFAPYMYCRDIRMSLTHNVMYQPCTLGATPYAIPHSPQTTYHRSWPRRPADTFCVSSRTPSLLPHAHDSPCELIGMP